MGSFTNSFEKSILDYLFGNTSFTQSANYQVGLSQTPITESEGNVTEPSGNNYSRVNVPNATTHWSAAVAGDPTTKQNAQDITFPTASGSWGTIVDFFIADSSGTVIIAYGSLPSSQVITSGDTAKFPTGSLEISLD